MEKIKVETGFGPMTVQNKAEADFAAALIRRWYIEAHERKEKDK